MQSIGIPGARPQVANELLKTVSSPPFLPSFLPCLNCQPLTTLVNLLRQPQKSGGFITSDMVAGPVIGNNGAGLERTNKKTLHAPVVESSTGRLVGWGIGQG